MKTPVKKRSSFTNLDATADGLLRRFAKGDIALTWLQARWARIVGEPLARKISPIALDGRRLTVSLLDPTWRVPVQATLAELERKLATEMPEIRPRVSLK